MWTRLCLFPISPGLLGSVHIFRHPLLYDSKCVRLRQGSPTGVRISLQPLGWPDRAQGGQSLWGWTIYPIVTHKCHFLCVL